MKFISQFFVVLAVLVSAGYNTQSVQAQTNVFPSYYEDFEKGDGGWFGNGTNSSWELGYPSKKFINRPAGGDNSWVTSLGSTYNSDEYSYLESPSFDMSCFTSDPYIGFNHTYFLQDNYDFHWLEISIDGGAWQKLGAANEGTAWYQGWKDAGQGEYIEVWGGDQQYNSDWEYAEHLLTGAAGKSNVRLRFVMRSDGKAEYDGVGIDDIQIFLPGAELSAPMLSTPANGESNVALSPSLTWQAAGCAMDYTIQVATDPNFKNTVFEKIQPGVSVTVGPLDYVSTYYWRVMTNSSSISSQWSDVYSFSTTNPPPPVPTLATPADGSKGIATENSTLIWNNSVGASSYHVQLSKSNTFGTIVAEKTTGANFMSPPVLENYTTYFWRVEASNSSGTSNWSDVWSFRTILAPTTLISPANGETYITNPATLSWKAVAGVDHYWIQIASDENFTIIVNQNNNAKEATYLANNLLNNTKYFWRVKVSTPDGENSDWSETRSFTTIIATPVLSLPLDGRVDLAPSVFFQWAPVDGDVQYNLQVSTDGTFNNTLFLNKTYSTLSQTISGLAGNTTYFWRVRAVSATSGNSGWSLVRTFSTIVAPTVGELPVDKAKGQTIPVTLAWVSSGPRVVYQVQIATDASFSTIVNDQSKIGNNTTDFGSYEGLKNNTVYFWHVRPLSNTGVAVDWSPALSFRTAIANATLVSPANNSLNKTLDNTKLKWLAVDGAISYRVQFSTDKSFATSIVDEQNITATEFTVKDLSVNSIYYWRVQATSTDNGTSAWSTVWRFSTGTAQLAGTPVLEIPANNAMNQAQTFDFQWKAAENVLTYHLQVSENDAFTTTVIDKKDITSASYAATGLQREKTYYWRVSGENETGEGSWSETWKFTLAPAAPAVPSLLLPANKSDKQSIVVTTLKWAAPATGATVTGYRIQVSTSSDFSSTIIDEPNVATNTYEAKGLAANAVYYWRVAASNAGGNSEWTEVWSFTTETSTGVQEGNNPSGFTFDAVTPNPAQTSASVNFTIANTAHNVALTVYSVTGQQVYSVNASELPAGTHNLTVNTTQIPVGVYVVRLTVDNSVHSTTVNVVK